MDGAHYESVGSAAEVMGVIWQGHGQRTVAAMKMNARSSRGHGIVSLVVRELHGDQAGSGLVPCSS